MIRKLLSGLLIAASGFATNSSAQNYFDKYVTFPDSVPADANRSHLLRTKDQSFLFSTQRFGFPNYRDILLIKFDASGNEIWASKIVAAQAQQCSFSGIAELPDSSFALSGLIGGAFGIVGNALMRVSKDGQLLYVKNIQSSDSLAGFGFDIVLLTDSTLSIASRYTPVSYGYKMGNIITDFNGNHLSNKFFTINNRRIIDGEYQKTADGFVQVLQMYDDISPSNPVVTGLLKATHDGTILWAKQITSTAYFKYSIHDIAELPSKHIILCGTTRPYGTGPPPERAFIACIDSSGTVDWLKHYSPVHTCWTSIAPYGSSSFLVAGTLPDSLLQQKGIVAKINVDGTLESYQYFRPDSCRVTYAISEAGDNNSCYTVFAVDSAYNNKNILMFTKYDDQYLFCDKITRALTDSIVTPVDSMQWSDTTLTFSTSDVTFLFTQFFDTLGLPDRCLTTHIENETYIPGLMLVYPNPATDKITISFAATTNESIAIKIYSITGEVVYAEEKKSAAPISDYQLPVTNLTNGIYFLSVQTGREVVTKKIVVNH